MDKKKELLVVDDNIINRQILKKILSDEYEIYEAENGKQALDILKEKKMSIAAILLDLIMPVMDGYELLKKMQAHAFYSLIPVIITSEERSIEVEVQAFSLGANDFLVKPYQPAIIKQRIANTIKLKERAYLMNTVQVDKLTGVLKKDFFYKFAQQTLKDNPETAYDIICCDIERFKLVNDLFGSSTGDQLLVHMATIINNKMDKNTLCGRIGADRFVCLVPHIFNCNNALFEDFIKEANQFPITIDLQIRFGIYIIHDSSIPVNVMCDRANIAANSIKGKYGVLFAYYDDHIRQELLLEQTILDNMKIGIEEKQFQVYYQPKYDLASGKVSGAEALIRWEHPERGLLTPAKFIPLFEKNGFISELDFYVWDNVCATLHKWIKDNKKITPISVNVSRTDIYNLNLPTILMGLIKKYQLKPQYLHLEITETAYTQNPEQLIAVVTHLKELGFSIEMDDFGSGYSSLNMLSQMPLDVLKLDIQFIRNETKKNSSKNILSFVISLAKWLNLSVVAEGVETTEQIDILRNMDCNYVQGYYYAKPMPQNEFEEHLLKAEIEDIEKIQKYELIEKDKVIVSNSNSEHIMMIVDDVELNRTILSEMFSNQYKIVEANNGKAAYTYIQKNYHYIDIILLDLVMPIMDGFQLLGKLKKDANLRSIPVIITSQNGEDSEERALAMGASDFVGKPYNKSVAVQRVNNVLAETKLKKILSKKEMFKEVERIRYQAEHDSLTGLYNRTALETIINTLFTNGNKLDCSFIMIDIDNFKTINDVFGHDKGDEVLCDVSTILKNHFRKSDIVARFGGDEFAVFMPSFSTMIDLKKRMNLVCEKIQLNYEGIIVTATMGAAIAPQHGSDYRTLYKNADIALLSAKRMGKNQANIYNEDVAMPSPVLSRNLDWLLDESCDGIMVCDAETYDLLYLNQVARKLSKKDKEDYVGKKCHAFLWGNDNPCSHCLTIDHMANDYCEYEINDPIKGKNYIVKGKVTEWGGRRARIQYIQDNTSKAMIAKQLSDISADRKQLLDFMPGGIFRYQASEDDQFDYVSESMLKMLGYTREAFELKFKNHFQNMVWHEDRERVLNETKIQIRNKDVCKCEYRIEKADGTLCWVHDIGHLVNDKEGRLWFYVSIMDFTKEHSITNTLKEERIKLQIALSHSGLHYWEHDLHSDVCINSEGGIEIGFPRIIKNYSEFLIKNNRIVSAYKDFYLAKQKELYEGKESVEYEMPILDKNNKQSWWHICCTNIFDDQGKAVKTIGTAENIDKFKMNHEFLIDNKKSVGE